MAPTVEEELKLWNAGHRRIAGVDEVGRGCWAGPVVAAAVVLPERVLAEPGKAYAVYVRGGTQAELVLELPAGPYTAEWVSTRTGQVEKAETFEHDGGDKGLTSPEYAEDIALRVMRR